MRAPGAAPQCQPSRSRLSSRGSASAGRWALNEGWYDEHIEQRMRQAALMYVHFLQAQSNIAASGSPFGCGLTSHEADSRRLATPDVKLSVLSSACLDDDDDECVVTGVRVSSACVCVH